MPVTTDAGALAPAGAEVTASDAEVTVRDARAATTLTKRRVRWDMGQLLVASTLAKGPPTSSTLTRSACRLPWR
jgi:hypothetical protein